MPTTKARLKVVFYDCCDNRSNFRTQAEAEVAAEEWKQAGYRCESYLCAKHLSHKGEPLGRWHIRAKTMTNTLPDIIEIPLDLVDCDPVAQAMAESDNRNAGRSTLVAHSYSTS